jgi:hypothetical protein
VFDLDEPEGRVMSTDAKRPTPAPPVPPTPAGRPRKTLDELIAEQGVAETATFENLLGKGAELWDSDEEFEQFMDHLRAIRRKKD